jgi:hypothetical protein
VRIPVDNLGAAGLIKDIYNQDTPPEAWTALRNARMGQQGAEKFLGHSKALGTDVAGWAVSPYWLFYVPVAGGSGFWVNAGQQKVYARLAISPYTETDISRTVGGNYAATESQKWNGCVFGGIAVFNNGVDEPQYWVPSAANDCTALSAAAGAAPWTAAHRVANLRSFGRFLVGIDCTIGGVRYPQAVRWSHPADPGALPTSWDYTAATSKAGLYPLSDATGILVEQRIIRDVNMLYTTDQVWQMRFVGGADVMGFSPIFHEQGILGPNCMARYKKDTEMHIVLGGDDIYVHNGQSASSILEPKLRRWFFQQLDPNYYARSFVVANPAYNEVWVCIPENGAEQPSLALVFNWKTGAIGFRDLLKASSGADTRTTTPTAGTPCITPGLIEQLSAETWDADTGTWDSDTTLWDGRISNPATPRLLMADRSTGKRTFLLDDTTQFDGSSFAWSLERVGLAIGGQDRQGAPKVDTEMVKLLTEIWPRVDAPTGTVLTIEVGTQDTPDSGVSWSSPYSYTVGTDLYVPTYESGKFLSFRFSDSGGVSMRLLGYAMEISPIGRF